MLKKSALKLSRFDYATYLGYAGYASGSVIIPMVLVAISGELGMDLASGGALHLIRSGVMIFSMILSGWAAEHFGKKAILGCSMLLIAAGLMLCSAASGYCLLAGAIILIGLGNGFFESLATGFTQDLHADDNPGRYINITHSFWPLGILLTVMGAGIFMEYNGQWRIPVITAAALLLIPCILFLCRAKKSSSKTEKFQFSKAAAPLKNPRFLIFLAALSGSALLLWHSREIYFEGKSFIPSFTPHAGEFWGRSITPDENTRRFFATGKVEQFRYTGENSDIFVLAVQCGGNIHEIHPASHCLRTGQWMVYSEKIIFLTNDFAVTEIDAGKGESRFLVWVWYSGKDFSTPGFLGFRRHFTPGETYHTYQISVPVVDDDVEKSRKILKKFIRSLNGEMPK